MQYYVTERFDDEFSIPLRSAYQQTSVTKIVRLYLNK